MLEDLEPEALRLALVVALVLAALGWIAALLLWRRGDRISAERDRLEENARHGGEVEGRARDAFEALVRPIDRALERTHEELARLGRDNAGLRSQVKGMVRANRELSRETSKLGQALRRPNVRGRWGEIQLERVVELAGMRPYCDFSAQELVQGADGRRQRPDLVVRLPNERLLAVDAKTPIDAYLDALDAEGEGDEAAADDHLARFAMAVVQQVDRLARKEYWLQFERSPEFVIMFVPGDQLVDAALSARPDLLEHAAARDVILASPSTLIGLLRAVHAGWREQRLSDGARELYELGRELHRRSAEAFAHTETLGRSLASAVERYNSLVSAVDDHVLPTLRRFEEEGAASNRSVANPARIGVIPRAPRDEVSPAPRRKRRRRRAGRAEPNAGNLSSRDRHDPE